MRARFYAQLDPVLDAHPDAAGLRDLAGSFPVLAVVTPYLEGTGAGEVAAALVDRPSRVLHGGVPGDAELRRYGSPRDHAAAHRLEAPACGAGSRSCWDDGVEAAERTDPGARLHGAISARRRAVGQA